MEDGSANSPQATAVPDEGRHQKAKKERGSREPATESTAVGNRQLITREITRRTGKDKFL